MNPHGGPGGPGETASTYAAVREIDQFSNGMARLAALFSDHPELKWLSATTDPTGHVEIIVNAGTGILRDWVHALPTARRKQDLYSVHSGAAIEEILIEGPITVHVRPRGGQ